VIQTETRGTQAQPPVNFEDHLGARFEAVSPDGDPVEVLELKERFAGIPAFEFALRKRVNTLTAFKDPSFATARGVRLGGGQPKQLLMLAGQPILQRSVDAFLR